VQSAAGELERGCLRGAAPEELAALTQQLDLVLSPVLAGLRELAAAPAAAVAVAEPGQIDAGVSRLRTLVEGNDPDAVQLAADLAALGRGSPAGEMLEELARALEAFDFEAATGLLDRLEAIAS